MKAKAVHKLSDEELTIEVGTLRKRMFELKNQSVTEKIQDTSQYGKIRKDIARLLSEQSVRSTSTQGKASSLRVISKIFKFQTLLHEKLE